MQDNDRLIAAIDAAEADAYGSDTDAQLAADRAYAINLYLGKNVDPVPEGTSTALDRSVLETIESIKPSLCRIFASGEDVVELPPIGPEDEEAAKQESQYLNFVITQKNNWFEVFLNWVSDALLTKNAYCMAYKDMFTSTSVERYERQTEMGLAALLQDKDVEVTGQRSYPDPDYVPPPPQQAMDPMTGQPVMVPPPPAPMLYDVELRRKAEKAKICLRVLPPERCKVSERTPSWRLEECDYFEFEDMKTISDLRSEGFDVDDDIASNDTRDSEEDQARDVYQESDDAETQVDPSMRRVKVRTIWIRHDFDEDGIAELQYVVRVGREILYREEVSRIPVACIVPTPLPHRHIGFSVADLVADIQRLKTGILRQGINNLFQSNNVRHAVSDKVNLDDMLMNRPGGLVRIEEGGIPENEIMPLPVPFVFPQAMEGLNYMDRVRQQRSGVSEYFTGIDENSMNDTASGIRQLSSMAEQRVEMIARIISTGVEDLFSIVHELILKAGHSKEVVKLRGKWVEVDPAQWKLRTDFKIAVGYAAGNNDALVQKQMMLAQMQEKCMAGGLPIVQTQNVYELATDITKTMGITSPNRFWTNPADAPKPQPPQPDVTVMAAEQMKTQSAERIKQAELQQKELESQREFEIKKYDIETRAATDVAKHEKQLAHERDTMQYQNEFGAQKDAHMAHVNASLNPKNVEAQAKAQESATASEVLKAMQQSQEQQTQIILAAFQELTKAMSAPREFVRDPKTGKAMGSRIAASTAEQNAA